MSDIIAKLERIKQTKTEIKDAIKTKGATCDTDCFREYPERILAIPSGGGGSITPSVGIVLQEKTITTNGQHFPDEGYGGFSSVTVKVPQTGGSDTSNAFPFIRHEGTMQSWGRIVADPGEQIFISDGVISIEGFYTTLIQEVI